MGGWVGAPGTQGCACERQSRAAGVAQAGPCAVVLSRAPTLRPSTNSSAPVALDAPQAYDVIQAEFGVPASQVFSSLSPEAVAGARRAARRLTDRCRCLPALAAACCCRGACRCWHAVPPACACRAHPRLHLAGTPACAAAASLGQVYRGVLRSTGEAVAVKVQRPGVASSIALDVFVLRQVGRARAGMAQWRGCLADGLGPPACWLLRCGWAAAMASRGCASCSTPPSPPPTPRSCWRWCGAGASSIPTCQACWMSGARPGLLVAELLAGWLASGAF